jgi:hypothetical protein
VAWLKGIRNALKHVKHSAPKPKFCPKCQCHRIYPVSLFGIMPTTYRCRECGYEGTMVFEIDLEEDARSGESNVRKIN